MSQKTPLQQNARVTAVLLALMLAFAPALGFARAGGGSSMGSRGSRTYFAPRATGVSPYAAPMQRSFTPEAPRSGFGQTAPGYANPGFGAGGMSRGRSAFTSGLLGGLIGAGIGGMLMGHGPFYGVSGGSGFLGLLLQIGIVVLLVRWLMRRFSGAGRQPSFAGLARGGSAPPPSGAARMGGGLAGGLGGRATQQPPLDITRSDYQAFEQLLRAVQAAWTAHDLNGLRRIVTPEMVGYFAEQLSDQASRGVRNEVTDVRLEQGDLSESWHDGGRDYATVAMRFGMIDVTRDASGRVVDGSSSERVTATEFWTFLRSPGGSWVLSAIQQGR